MTNELLQAAQQKEILIEPAAFFSWLFGTTMLAITMIEYLK